MRVPILSNARNVIRGWHTGEFVEPEVRYEGYGPDLEMTAVAQLLKDLTALTKSLPSTDEGRRLFDQSAAKLLGNCLGLPPAAAADKRFWQWFAITQAEDVVLWRWKKPSRELVSTDRWLGGWKDTFRRLWLRANVVQEPGATDPFELAGHGDEDFWVGIIERDIAGCRTLVRSLVRNFFIAGGVGATETKKRMLHYRATIKRLRQIRPSRVYEQMYADEVDILVREAMTAAQPGEATAAKRKPKRKGRKAVKKTARRKR